MKKLIAPSAVVLLLVTGCASMDHKASDKQTATQTVTQSVNCSCPSPQASNEHQPQSQQFVAHNETPAPAPEQAATECGG